jgi:hypothetical protein
MSDIYRRFIPDQNYEELLFRAGKGLQSAELNDTQAEIHHRIKGIGDSIFKDGDIMSDADCIVTDPGNLGPNQVQATLTEGTIYIQGMVRVIPSAQIIAANNELVVIGAYLTKETITELEDPDLRDPAVGTRNYQEPGAIRTKYDVVWGIAGQGTGDFFPIHKIDNGVLIQQAPPPQLNNVTQALARYDRESNGHYIVKGMKVIAVEGEADKQTFVIEEGKSHVNGFEVELGNSIRKIYDEDPDLSLIETEPHTFNPTDGKMRVNLNSTPLANLVKVNITKRKTITMTRGNSSGGMDVITDPSVTNIVEVRQGPNPDDVFDKDIDYRLTANKVDWSLSGGGTTEPAPSSTYDITYDYLTDGTIEEDSQDDTGFTVSGAVDGTLVLVDYNWKLPRFDRIVVDREGLISRVKGVSHAFRPVYPKTPENSLGLAIIQQTWSELPTVINDGVRVVPMGDIESLRDNIYDLYSLVASERLRNNANLSDPSSKRGIFVDPFFDDDLRDAGEPQTAAIVNGELILPIGVTILDASSGNSPWTLDYELEPILEQNLKSTQSKINPYQAFPPIPAQITLEPAIDEWTQTVVTWASSITRRITSGSGRGSSIQVSQGVEVLSRQSTAVEFMRSRTVDFTIEGFDSNEALNRVDFGGVTIIDRAADPAVGGDFTADVNGVVTGDLAVPPSIPSGSVNLEFFGFNGSFGETTYISRGIVTMEERRSVRTITTNRFRIRPPDPLAQTFTLPEGRFVGGVELWFKAIGDVNKPVYIQLRDVVNGIPVSPQALTAGILQMTDVNLDQWTRIEFPPVYLEADREYAFVILTDDADHAVAVAELGKYDIDNGWITEQPYTVGVMLSSSNASTWTPHQTQDLTFRLLGASFIQLTRTVVLGSIEATQISDLLALGGVERPTTEADITLLLVDDQGVEYRLTEGEPLALPERVNGTLSVRAELNGTQTISPVLFPHVLAILGNLAEEATYVSRAIPAPRPNGSVLATVRVTYEAILTGDSEVDVHAETTADTWVQLPDPLPGDIQAVGDGWDEYTHIVSDLSFDQTRIKLTLKGNPLYRPRVRNLQVIVI